MLQEKIAGRTGEPLTLAGGISVAVTEGADMKHSSAGGGLSVLHVVTGSGGATVAIEVPLGLAAGYWHPEARYSRTIRPDYEGVARSGSMLSAPVGCLYDDEGRSVAGFLVDLPDETVVIRFGVSEERKTYVIHLELPADRAGDIAVMGPGVPLAEAVSRLVGAGRRTSSDPLLPLPEFAGEPVYSTWYAFAQDVDAEALAVEAQEAAKAGFGSVFLDDGWQRHGHGRGYAGCGDWVPDTRKFPDLRAFVASMHALGLKVVLWIAPLYLGERSEAFARLRPSAPRRREGHAQVLDPRIPLVRKHLVDTCVRLVRDYGLDGLKLDFLEDADLYADSLSDSREVAAAMRSWLGELCERLAGLGLSEPLVEFREPYVSPALAPFGNVLRAGDCPGDVVLNRTSIGDLRLLAGGRVVHSDMVLWSDDASPEAVARQLYATLFAVPQVSVRLSRMTDAQRSALAAGLEVWHEVYDVVAHGQVHLAAPTNHYPAMTARDASGRVAVVAYERLVVDVDPDGDLDLGSVRELIVVNASNRSGVVLDAGPHGGGSFLSESRTPCGTALRTSEIELRGLCRVPAPPFGVARLRRRTSAW